jgi:hypothetical protein
MAAPPMARRAWRQKRREVQPRGGAVRAAVQDECRHLRATMIRVIRVIHKKICT